MTLTKFNAMPNASAMYLALFTSTHQPANIRGMSGLLLKNLLRKSGKRIQSDFADGAFEGIQLILQNAEHESHFVISTAATILAVLVDMNRPKWPALLHLLLKAITSARNLHVVAASLTCIERILEECGEELNADHSSLSYVILTLLSPRTSSSNGSIRVLCLKSINHILSNDPDSVDMDSLLDSLSHCAVSEFAEERRLTCLSLSLLVGGVAEERMAPSKPAINSFMLRALNDTDEGVAMEACEYWNGSAERGIEEGDVLTGLIPSLVNKIAYSADDPEVLNLAIDGSEASENYYPRHHKTSAQQPDESDSDSESEAEGYSEWTLRKCSASTIDLLSSSCDSSVFLQILLPSCQELLHSDSYLKKEAAILIIGAIAEGCREEMGKHLSMLMPFLIRCLQKDNQPLVRSIAAWTVGRYHEYVHSNSELLSLSMQSLAEMLNDSPYVKCRRAACSSIAVFSDSHDIASFIPHLFPYISVSLGTYSSGTLPNLLDLIISVSKHICLLSGDEVSHIMHNLSSRFLHSDNNQIIYPLSEALIALLLSVDKSVSYPVAPSLYSHSVSLIEGVLNLSDENANVEMELAAAALDLLGALIRGVQCADQKLLAIVSSCASSSDPVLLQSLFALVGDIASCMPGLIFDNVVNIAQMLLQHFDPAELNSDAAGNAIWAWGAIMSSELKVKIDGPLAIRSAQELCNCLLLPSQSRSYYDNVVIALGNTLGAIADIDASINIEGAIPRMVRLLSVNSDKEQRERASLGILGYIGSHSRLLSSHPAEAIRIALCAGRDNPQSMNLMHIVKDKIIGMAGWEDWRASNLPDIPAGHLP